MSSIPDTLNLIMQKGIEGGFAPPTPNALYRIARQQGSDVLVVSAQIRPHGTAHLLPAQTKELKVADHAGSIARLQDLLRDLPVQYPGARDLYGRNTSIVQEMEASSLQKSGSAAGMGVPQPTEEQRVRFDEAVAIIEGLGA